MKIRMISMMMVFFLMFSSVAYSGSADDIEFNNFKTTLTQISQNAEQQSGLLVKMLNNEKYVDLLKNDIGSLQSGDSVQEFFKKSTVSDIFKKYNIGSSWENERYKGFTPHPHFNDLSLGALEYPCYWFRKNGKVNNVDYSKGDQFNLNFSGLHKNFINSMLNFIEPIFELSLSKKVYYQRTSLGLAYLFPFPYNPKIEHISALSNGVSMSLCIDIIEDISNRKSLVALKSNKDYLIELDKLYQFLAKYNSSMGNVSIANSHFAASDLTRSLISKASMDFSDLDKKEAPVKNKNIKSDDLKLPKLE